MSKRLVSGVIGTVALLLGVLYFLTSGSHEPIHYPPKAGAMLAFGDSLVAGVGSSGTEGFIGPLEDLLGTEILNKGVPGDTTQDGLVRLQTDVLDEKPAIVFLLLGGNDFLRKVPREETFANLETMIHLMQEQGILVVLLGVQSGLFFDTDESDFKKLARNAGALYIPNVLDGIYGNGSLMHDAIHPNEEGYRNIAVKIHTALVDWDIATHSL